MSKIKLPPFQQTEDTYSFGFFGTAEGRKFLRYCYRLFFEHLADKTPDAPPTHGKIASLICDDVSAELQKREVTNTAQALYRWVMDAQKELYQGDISKTLRILERLEAILAREENIRAIMTDRAATIRKTDVANALALFFYGGYSPYDRAITRQLLEKSEGLYSIWVRAFDHDRYPVSYYKSDNFYALKLDPHLPVFTIHEFHIDGGLIKQRRSGFQFVAFSGQFLRFLVSHEDPSSRWMETFTPGTIDEEVKHMYPLMEKYHITVNYIDTKSGDYADKNRKGMIDWTGPQKTNLELLAVKASKRDEQEFSSLFSGNQWDIPL